MQGAENLLLKDQKAVAVMVEEKVVRRGRRSTAGCCRCSICEAVLATLLVLAVAAAVALGYMWFTQDKNYDDASHKCYRLQWKSNVKDYEVFTAEKNAKYYIYGWIAFNPNHSATAALMVYSDGDEREISTSITIKNLAVLSEEVFLWRGHNVSVRLQRKFTTATVCTHKLPAKSN